MNRRFLSLGLLAVLVGCTQIGSPRTDPPASLRPATSSPTLATAEPLPSALPATPTTTAAPQATATPAWEDPVPPDAVLTLPDGRRQVGAVGSYFFGGAALDTPWLPARVLPDLEAERGGQLTFSVPPLQVVSWSARYADAQDEQAELISALGSGGDAGTPLESAVLPALPNGSWVLAIQVYFADEAGDATYYWHVTVP